MVKNSIGLRLTLSTTQRGPIAHDRASCGKGSVDQDAEGRFIWQLVGVLET
jgi:hypothetical protein